jgi:hypothetical protein
MTQIKIFKKVILKGERFEIRRVKDNFGGRGNSLAPVSKSKTFGLIGENGEIRVGHRLYCGRFLNYVCTSIVVDIIEISEDNKRAIFRTQNSTYIATGADDAD